MILSTEAKLTKYIREFTCQAMVLPEIFTSFKSYRLRTSWRWPRTLSPNLQVAASNTSFWTKSRTRGTSRSSSISKRLICLCTTHSQPINEIACSYTVQQVFREVVLSVVHIWFSMQEWPSIKPYSKDRVGEQIFIQIWAFRSSFEYFRISLEMAQLIPQIQLRHQL